MIHTTYKNFSLNSQSELDKYIHSSSERQFFFTESKNLINKYLYHQKKTVNKTSLTSTQDGDPVIFFVDGDYTIPTGTTITHTNRCIGLYIFINGTLTNIGTISMTARVAHDEGRIVSITVGHLIRANVRSDITNRWSSCFY